MDALAVLATLNAVPVFVLFAVLEVLGSGGRPRVEDNQRAGDAARHACRKKVVRG